MPPRSPLPNGSNDTLSALLGELTSSWDPSLVVALPFHGEGPLPAASRVLEKLFSPRASVSAGRPPTHLHTAPLSFQPGRDISIFLRRLCGQNRWATGSVPGRPRDVASSGSQPVTAPVRKPQQGLYFYIPQMAFSFSSSPPLTLVSLLFIRGSRVPPPAPRGFSDDAIPQPGRA